MWNIAACSSAFIVAGLAAAHEVHTAAGFAVVNPAVAATAAPVPIVPAAAAAAPAGPVGQRPPLQGGVRVPAGMQRIPIMLVPPSLHGPGPENATAGGLVTACQYPSNTHYGFPIASGGAPLTIRVHLITLEKPIRDAIYGGWLLLAGRYLQTGLMYAHTIAELNLRTRPYLV